MSTTSFVKGPAFPLRINPRGGIKESSQAQKIRESILVILGTQHGERIMRPKFGCNLKSLIFSPINASTANLARHYIEEGLTTWEPRIILDDINIESDIQNGRLMIHLHYKLKSSFEPQNLVYPFYLESQQGRRYG